MNDRAHRLPLTMTTVFQDLFLLTYAVPPAALARLLPRCIEPYVRDDRSYISIVAANIRGMRATPLPEFLGTNYYQIVYRAVVRVVDPDGGERPGVFFLRSDGNDPVMSFFGNRLTEFRFHYFRTGHVSFFERADEFLITVESGDARGDLVAHLRREGPAQERPPAKGFQTVADEKDSLVQLFHAFAYDREQNVVLDLEIDRGEWEMERLSLEHVYSTFFQEHPFGAGEAEPISHLYIRECRYVWKPMVVLPGERLRFRRSDADVLEPDLPEVPLECGQRTR